MSAILKLSPTTIDKHSRTERDNLVRCVKKPRGECKVNINESSVIGMIELIETK